MNRRLSVFVFTLYVLALAFFSVSKSAGWFSTFTKSLERSLGGDKAMHLMAAALLGLISSFLIDYRHRAWLKKVLTVFLIILLLVSIDEFLQFFLKNRVFDLYDLYYGWFGVCTGVFLGLILNLCFLKLKKNL